MVIDIGGSPLTLRTDRGVFSHGRLDPGTAVLLRAAPPPPPEGTFLDLGAGSGALVLALARLAPAADGVGSRRQRAGAASLTRVECRCQRIDQRLRRRSRPRSRRTSASTSSGPTRRSVSASRRCTTCCRRGSADSTPDGRAVLVVQKHLGADSLQRWLIAEGWPTTRLGSARGYRLPVLPACDLAPRWIDLDADHGCASGRGAEIERPRTELFPRRRGAKIHCRPTPHRPTLRRRCAASSATLVVARAATPRREQRTVEVESRRRRSVSGIVSRPGSASSAACTTSWRGRNVCTEQPPPPRARPDQPGAAHEQRHRLLGRPVARRQQLGVEIEERHHVGRAAPDAAPLRCRRRSPAAAGGSVVVAGDGDHRSPGGRLQLLAQPGDARVAGWRTPTRRSRGTPPGARAAAAAGQHAVVGQTDGRLAALAPRQRPARPAGQHPCPPGRVVHAHHGPRVVAQVGDQRRRDERRFHGSSRLRSTTSTIGQPAALVVDRRPPQRSPTAARPPTVGHGDTSTTGTPARRARSMTTSRACHVGLRSSCSASSCSSRTTTAASRGHGAHAAARAPMTTSTPAAASAQSCGHDGHRQPGRVAAAWRRSCPVDRRHDDEHGTEPRPPPPARAARRRSAASRSTPPPPPSRRAGVGMYRLDGDVRCVARAAGRRRRGGLAATRNGRRRPAAQRTDAQRARSISSAVGPTRADLGDRPQLRSTRRQSVGIEVDDPAADAPPWSGTRTIVPTSTSRRQFVGNEVVELLVEPGDVGQDPGDARAAGGVRRAIRRRRRP